MLEFCHSTNRAISQVAKLEHYHKRTTRLEVIILESKECFNGLHVPGLRNWTHDVSLFERLSPEPHDQPCRSNLNDQKPNYLGCRRVLVMTFSATTWGFEPQLSSHSFVIMLEFCHSTNCVISRVAKLKHYHKRTNREFGVRFPYGVQGSHPYVALVLANG